MKKSIVCLFLLALLGSSARAQVPDKFSNLRILPGDIGKRELVDTMRGFSMGLGMRCIGCHEIQTPGDYSSIDWASEKLHNKKVARGMMKLTQEVNGNLLPAATGEHDFQIRCITCHRGLDNPRTLDEVLLRVAEREGAEAAEQKYRDLREEYYGHGSYDFSPSTLNTVAEVLAQEKQDPTASRLMAQLNLEMNPGDAPSLLMLAQLDLAAGDEKAARANIEKVLAKNPQHRQARRLLEQLGQ